MKRVTVARLIQMVSAAMDVPETHLVSHRRDRRAVHARQVVMHLARIHTAQSLPQIGRLLGGRDHTTVVHGCRQMEALLASGHEELCRVVDVVELALAAIDDSLLVPATDVDPIALAHEICNQPALAKRLSDAEILAIAMALVIKDEPPEDCAAEPAPIEPAADPMPTILAADIEQTLALASRWLVRPAADRQFIASLSALEAGFAATEAQAVAVALFCQAARAAAQALWTVREANAVAEFRQASNALRSAFETPKMETAA